MLDKKICIECGREHQPMNYRQKFCTPQCKDINFNKKWALKPPLTEEQIKKKAKEKRRLNQKLEWSATQQYDPFGRKFKACRG